MKYYALFTCDLWKSKESMKLLGVFTKSRLIATLKDDRFSLNDPINKTMDCRELNDICTYGYIEELSINEIL